jgi:hypothetical protein
MLTIELQLEFISVIANCYLKVNMEAIYKVKGKFATSTTKLFKEGQGS